MDQILDAFGDSIGAFFDDPTIQLALRAIGIYIVFVWLAAAYWAYRDLQTRTANPIAPYLAAAMIILFTPIFFPFGIILYRIIRPSETVAEANERALAEEAMLVEVESQPHCANCARRVHADWIICPTCRNRLRRVCPNCSRLVELDWSLCAWCGKDFERPETLREVLAPAPRRRLAASEPTTAVPALGRSAELGGSSSRRPQLSEPAAARRSAELTEPGAGASRRTLEMPQAPAARRAATSQPGSETSRSPLSPSMEPLPADGSTSGRSTTRRR
jgi:RNA polymerase subunit RPABC4/transcription elongation factor Spt4